MADDFRPHLLITEDDAETLENVKQARSKDLGEYSGLKRPGYRGSGTIVPQQ